MINEYKIIHSSYSKNDSWCYKCRITIICTRSNFRIQECVAFHGINFCSNVYCGNCFDDKIPRTLKEKIEYKRNRKRAKESNFIERDNVYTWIYKCWIKL